MIACALREINLLKKQIKYCTNHVVYVITSL